MEKIISELVEMANEGIKEALIVIAPNGNLSINFKHDKIDSEYIVGEIDLKVYATYEDIKEEIKYMLEA